MFKNTQQEKKDSNLYIFQEENGNSYAAEIKSFFNCNIDGFLSITQKQLNRMSFNFGLSYFKPLKIELQIKKVKNS